VKRDSSTRCVSALRAIHMFRTILSCKIDLHGKRYGMLLTNSEGQRGGVFSLGGLRNMAHGNRAFRS
jgi:hypothetical protein